MNLGVISRLSDMVVDADIAPIIRTRASEVLALLCADKKRGPEVRPLLHTVLQRTFSLASESSQRESGCNSMQQHSA